MTRASPGDDRHARRRRDHDRQQGQATVEVVLTLPVVTLLVLLVVQIGLVVSDRLLLAHAAREGARAAAVRPEHDVVVEAATTATGLEPDRLSVALSGGDRAGDRATVTVRYRSPTDLPLIGSLLPDVDLRSEVTMRVE